MRVISGIAGRLQLDAPKSMARPSTDRLREALFSILGERVVEARVLDLFAGSGALGIEALSRGASSASFVDQDRAALTAIQANLKRTRLAEHAQVANQDVYAWLTRLREGVCFDLVFADPPYVKRPGDEDHAAKLLEGKLASMLDPEGLLVLETGEKSLPKHPETWKHVDSRHYGRSHLHFFAVAE